MSARPTRPAMLSRLAAVVGSSLRRKLLLLVLSPILLLVPLILWAAGSWSLRFSYEQLFQRVSTELSVAHDAFNKVQAGYLSKMERLADSYTLRRAFEQGELGKLMDQLSTLQKTAGFDFLHLTDLEGQRLFDGDGVQTGRSKRSPLIEKAGRWGIASTGVEVFSRQDLEKESPRLADGAWLALLDTPHAAPTERTAEDRAMVLRIVAPVRDAQEQLVALLDGGVILNRNFQFVDAIRDLAYQPRRLDEDGGGTVTVFLDDVRITTNVPLKQGERALGTRVSQAVRDKVLLAGERWVDRAFVVNDWYISAYEPIMDVEGKRIGMLYTGYLEAPYRNAYRRAFLVLAALLGVVALVAGLAAIIGAKSIFQPIEAMTAVVRATQAGEEKRIGPIASRDEIGELARQFDRMLDQLNQRSHEIRKAAEELELKVEERTRELQEKNARLQETIDLLHRTRQQLILAEKLAALGELTAGVAHEINNPVAVILGNMDVLINELGGAADPVKTEIDLIIEQIYRIRAIVGKLLQYSRPTDLSGHTEHVEVAGVIDDTLVLVKHEIDRKAISVDRSYECGLRVSIGRPELQQVLVNLLINAAHAVDVGGHIELTTRPWVNDGVVISVRDDGIGISEKQLPKIFDPFFTTKAADGTGLGLSVSYGIINSYGGTIGVESEVGKGTTFEIYLHRKPKRGKAGEVRTMPGSYVA